MAFPYPFTPTLNLPNSIGIGNKTGAFGMFFTNISEPVIIPEFMRKRKVTLIDMMPPGTGQMGNRIIEAYQTNENRFDIEFSVDYLTPTQVSRLRGYVTDSDTTNPGYVLFTPDNNTTVYLGVFAEDYPMIENYRYNLQICSKAKLKIHILGLGSGAVTV